MAKGIVVLTGASGGMGTAVRRLLEEKDYLVWSLDITGSDDVHFIRTDITSAESVEKAARRIESECGKIDSIVHTAGIYDINSLVEMSEEEFLRIFNINIFGMYRVNKAFLPMLNPNSRIIMVSSELAPLDPLPFTGIYGITKSTIEKYAYSLRMELQLLGHKVSVIRPGAVKTQLLDVSQKRIENFCDNTQLYKSTSRRFLKLVNKVETANVKPEKVAAKIARALEARRPRYVYNINRSPLLRLLNILPQHMQNSLIRRILSNR